MGDSVLSHALIGFMIISSVLASGCASSPITTTPLMITIYCVSSACTPQNISAGAGTLVQGCYRNLDECTAAMAGTTTIPATTLPVTTTAQSYSVSISGFAFNPATLTVPLGTTVTWTNQDGAPHTITSDTAITGFDSATMSQGQTYSYTFTQAGTYAYHCSIHTSMHGTIIVQ